MDSRSITKVIALTLIIAFAASCDKNDGMDVPFAVSRETFELDASESRTSFIISSSSPWSIKSDASWCKVVPSSGSPTSSEGTSVTLVADRNEGIGRNCDVFATSQTGEKYVIKVSQRHDDNGIILEKDTFHVSGQTTSVQIPFLCSGTLKAETPDDWLKTSVAGNGTIVLEMEEYQSLANRTGTVFLYSSDGSLKSIRVTQGDGFNDHGLYDILLSQYDQDKDGILSKKDLAILEEVTVPIMGLSDEPIRELSGFECIPNLKILRIIEYFHWPHEPLVLKLNGLKNLTEIDFGSDLGWASFISSMEISGCPKLGKIDFHAGYTLKTCVIRDNHSLKELRLSDGYFSVDDSSYLNYLTIDGCDNLESVMISFAAFEEDPSLGSLPKLQHMVIDGTVRGIRCLDLSESVILKTVTAYSDGLEYILLPSSLRADVTIDTYNKVTVLYR